MVPFAAPLRPSGPGPRARRLGRVKTHPYGSWPSPITPASLTVGEARLDEPRPDGADTYWLEGRPWEQGRVVLVRRSAEGTQQDVTPEPFNVRSRVHEYGGGAYAVRDEVVVFSDFSSGRLYRVRPGEEPTPITPEAQVRFGGLVLSGRHVYAVREDHRSPGEPVNELVRLDTEGENLDLGEVIHTGTDFVSRPAICADGRQGAWVVWDHPNMPWDSTRIVLADLTDPAGSAQVVAGGPGISVVQPRFAPDGSLYFMSDETGYWNVWKHTPWGSSPVHTLAADLADPQWLLGFVDYAVIDDAHLLVRTYREATGTLAVLDTTTGALRELATEGVAFTHIHAVDGDLLTLRARADGPPQVVRGPLDGEVRVLAGPLEAADTAYLSRAVHRTWSDPHGRDTHGFFYPPVNGDVTAPQDSAPPLMVIVHGGPTSHAAPSYMKTVQFWTTRGFAVLDVNHGGSTAYGRDFRRRLNGAWGVVDIEDSVAGIADLAAHGLIDAERVVIRGGSAGGYTTLRALTATTAFAAGTSYFGISDLVAMVEDDHKFESRYIFSMIGPWPEAETLYRDRSPINHLDTLHGELLLLQGADDLVVKEDQATLMADALRALGKEVELVVYPGEGHGFRRADTIIDSLSRELAFYQRVFDARRC